MAPPVTPSPHRFLPGLARDATRDQLRIDSVTASSSSSKPSGLTQRLQGQTSTQLVPEPIDSPNASPAPRKTSTGVRIVRSTEHDDITSSPIGQSINNEPMQGEPPPFKRRRIAALSDQRNEQTELLDLVILSSSPPASRSPSLSPILSPETARTTRVNNATTPATKFLLSNHVPSQAPLTQRVGDLNAPLLKTSRPGFVLPAEQSREGTADGMTAIVSPFKKAGGSFTTGGLASTLRDWVLEMEASPAAGGLDERLRKQLDASDESTEFEIMNVEGSSTGTWCVRSVDQHAWLLVGIGGYGSSDARPITAGCIVTVKQPTWTVWTDDQRREVAVRWAIK